MADIAKWNISDTNAGILLSNNYFTAKATTTAHKSARCDTFKSSGKWYWEITINTGNVTDGYVFIGIGTSSATISSYLCSNAYGWGYDLGARKCTNATFGAYGAEAGTGSIISVLLDLDAGTLIFWKNGSTQGTAYTGLSGSFAPMVSLYAANLQITANFGFNFGDGDFTYEIPEGYSKFQPTVEISGVVEVEGAAAERTVRVHDRLTGEILGETTSDSGDGSYEIDIPDESDIYVVCLDTDHTYNDLIYGKSNI